MALRSLPLPHAFIAAASHPELALITAVGLALALLALLELCMRRADAAASKDKPSSPGFRPTRQTSLQRPGG